MVQPTSMYDQLTGLLTRKAFEDRLAAAIDQAQADQSPLTLALVDIDEFMQINQKVGHTGGDIVLKCLGDIIRRAGEGIIGTRYGGDEFALLFPNTEREQAFLKLERMRTEVEGQTSFQDGDAKVEILITISAGVAALPMDGSDASELMRKADGAMYRAKAGGRNKIVLSYEERMAPKTSHYTLTQLERLASLAKEQDVGEAVLLREALDDLLVKYQHGFLSKR